MQYEVRHVTRYDYADEVPVSHHVTRLRPRRAANQRCLTHRLEVSPATSFARARADYYGNEVTLLGLTSPHRQLVVTALSQVEVHAPPTPAAGVTPPWETVRDALRGRTWSDDTAAAEFAVASPMVTPSPAVAAYAAPAFPSGRPVFAAVLELTQQIFRDFTFDPQATSVATPVETVLRQRRGVCQDFAHLQVACLRALGLAARYVSGYLETAPPAGQTKLVGTDASHAWVAFWCPGHGWIDVDPTNNLVVGARHITLAWGRDFADVSPLRGIVVSSGKHRLRVAVDVVPIPAVDGPESGCPA